jgi:hypothetical protein
MGLNEIHNPIATGPSRPTLKSAEQRFEDAVIDYSRDTGRTPPSKNEIKDGASLLQKGSLSIKDLAKNLFQSQNSQDIETLTQIVKQSGIINEPNPTPQGQSKSGQLSPLNPKLNSVVQENQQSSQSLNITTTKVENQVILGHIINLIKTGSPKNAYESASQEPDLINSVLESFGKQNQADQTQIKNMMGFIAAMESNPGANKPEVLAQARRFYSKLQKELEELEETDTDESKISDEAKAFMGDLNKLTTQLKQLEGEWPKEMEEAYRELMDILEMGKHG